MSTRDSKSSSSSSSENSGEGAVGRPQAPRVNQVWQDKDSRFPNRRVRVVGVEDRRVGYRVEGTGRLAYSQTQRFMTAFQLVPDETTDALGRVPPAPAPQLPWKVALGFNTSWPVSDVLKKLADAAEHLLRDHNCDAHGWEGITHAVDAARYISSNIDAILSIERVRVPAPAPQEEPQDPVVETEAEAKATDEAMREWFGPSPVERLAKRAAVAEDALARLTPLVARWRYEKQGIDRFHATLGSGWGVCADELERALAPAPDRSLPDPKS